MPVSLGEWRVRIGTFIRRRKKEYDYNYFWNKLVNLIKRAKDVQSPEENNSECNTSPRTRQTQSQCDSPECDDVKESGSSCDVKSPGPNEGSHSESSCADNSTSPTANKINPVPDTTEVQIPVPRPCVKYELDNRHKTINIVAHEYPPNSTDQPEVATSESYSHVPAAIAGETDRIQIYEEETSNSAPSWIEDQSSGLSPKPRQDTTRNTKQTTPSIREVTENHGSPTYLVPLPGTTTGEADTIKGNDCPDMTNMLLLRSGDVERNPGPNDNPGSLTELELYLLAEGMDSSDFRNVGQVLGFSDDQLIQFEKDKPGDPMQATYQMLYEWRKTVHDSEARCTLVDTLESIKLVQLADSIRTGQAGDHIPSLTAEEIKRVAEEVKCYYTLHLCQIQADPLNNELLLKFDQIFTNLTLMEEDKSTKHKTPLLYDDLLRTEVNGIYPKRLLVEGEGGVGKTTFCAKIAWDWIHRKGYQEFKLVLVILFREAKEKTVGEIVKTYLSDNNPVTAKQLDKHILSNPDGDVFLVMDGLDESTIDLNSNQQIALITSNRLFNSGTVLITSRQWRSDEMRKNANLRKVFAFIAVEGFSAENLSSYITKFFHQDTGSSEDLNRFISNNDVIRENMAPYPIYTAMLCIMWKEFDGEHREAMLKLQTFSQLFNEMIDFLVDHYISKHIPSSGIVEGELKENRSDIRHRLLQMGHIAFKGLLERRLVFTEEEFQSYPESIDVGCKVGVLTREKKVLPRRDRRNNPNSAIQTVQFPHKLFQEYLSGMYLASLYNSNRNEYDRVIVNIIQKAGEYRYLLYFTSAQQKEVGLDIISRLTARKRQRRHGDDFVVDVAYESQDQIVAKAVADHLSSETLDITEDMQAHTVSGHIFIMNHRQVDNLVIEKSCGRTASENLAEYMGSSRSPRSVTMECTATMHDVFYSVLANKAVDSKIETLNIKPPNLSERPSASRDFAQFICKMPHLKRLNLGSLVLLHDVFYSTSASMASSAKIETFETPDWTLSERPSASRDFAQFICNMPHLKNLTLDGQYHNDFYSTSSSMASSAKDSAASSLPQVDLSWLSTTTGPERKRKKRRDTSAPKRGKGRPSVRDKFPEVILTASRYIADNGFRAHRRRQESIGTCGSTIKNIKEHVQETVPGLQESHPNLSDRTVARWMMPPNRSCNASKSYAGLIEARVPAKDNSARKGNDNSHFYSARVRYLMECASKHSHEVMIYSADNKNKVKVGDTTLAVDRRIKIRKIFPTNDKPVYYDHDFPTPGYLLTPSGYLELEPSTLLTKDNLGRDHYVTPQPGPSDIILRSPNAACNIASHLDNMSQIIQRKSSHKSVLFMIVDGGPDFNVNHITNMFYYSRFFKDADLAALVITSYCPGDSALNPIEHLWAPCTHALASVYLRSTLEGEAVPPCAQARLSAQEKLTKEHMVFDAATSSIRDVHWNHLTFNGSDVNVHCVPSGYVPECGKDYVEVKRVLSGSAKALKESDFKDNFDFCMQHIDRRIGTIIFTKCKREECLYCARKPPQVSAELLDCLHAFPSPQPSSMHPGHFMTFGESLLVPRAPPCEHLPLFREKGLGRCSFPECSYVFNSQKDVTDHRRKFH